MYYSARATLINNTCNNNKYQGIFISGSAGSTLINNTIQNNGFYVSEDSIESYLNYTLENNLVNGKKIGFYINQDGLILSEPGYAQYILINCSEVVICNQELTNTAFGIDLKWCENATIVNNTCNDNDYESINVENSTNVMLINNICNSNRDGISVSFSFEIILENNTCNYNSHDGISVEYTTDVMLQNNTCFNNERDGFHILLSDDAWILNNTCNDNLDENIHVLACPGVVLENNVCNGIYLRFSPNATLTNNFCYDNDWGIRVELSSYIVLIDNICQNNYFGGIRLYHSSWATLTKNVCNNNDDGILVQGSSFVTLTDNTCNENNYVGIYLVGGSSSLISNNTCKYNNWGIGLSNSVSCLITYNLLKENEEYGIAIESGSDGNTIHHNIFISNNLGGTSYAYGGTSQAYDMGTNNTWYEEETKEGNFWSDWDKKKPYPIDGSVESTDLYPLNENMERINYSSVILISSIMLLSVVGTYMRRKKV